MRRGAVHQCWPTWPGMERPTMRTTWFNPRQVVAGPFDAPWVRTTVVTDPQGATFTASKFVPENKTVAPDAGA